MTPLFCAILKYFDHIYCPRSDKDILFILYLKGYKMVDVFEMKANLIATAAMLPVMRGERSRFEFWERSDAVSLLQGVDLDQLRNSAALGFVSLGLESKDMPKELQSAIWRAMDPLNAIALRRKGFDRSFVEDIALYAVSAYADIYVRPAKSAGGHYAYA